MFSSSLFVTMTMGVAYKRLVRWELELSSTESNMTDILVDGVGSVADGHDLVAFLFEEDDVGLQQLYLVIDP